MKREEHFDAFYRATRRDLLHQTFALTGDLGAAAGAVKDAYVAAWHHWRKVSTLDDPVDWVRPRAWRLAQRRRTTRIRSIGRGSLSSQDTATLDALGMISNTQRKILVLVELAQVPLSAAARQVGVTQGAAEAHLRAAREAFAGAAGIPPAAIVPQLDRLAWTSEQTHLPRAATVRRAGRKRRQSHTVLATAAAAVIALASGAFAYQPSGVTSASRTRVTQEQPSSSAGDGAGAQDSTGPTAGHLLDADQIARLGGGQEWRIRRTSDNTAGDGINTICQQSRFADPEGLAAVVRTFQASGRPRRSAVQTVEVSASPVQAQKAFDTTLGWYAGCQVARLQLLTSYRVDGVGDEAQILVARVWKRPVTTYAVALARVGDVITSTVSAAAGSTPPRPWQVTASLADAVAMLCDASEGDTCGGKPSFRPVPPPPSGEERGILAVADLPPVGRVDHAWVGTRARSARANPAATTCDRASFTKAGAAQTRTRTFLIPQARLPDRFGLSETYGVFRTGRAADRFLAGVRAQVSKCEDRDLAAHVSNPWHRRSARHLAASSWDLRVEISDNESVRFRLGFVRVGNAVSQLTFAPTDRDDMSTAHFRELLVRAGERLGELG